MIARLTPPPGYTGSPVEVEGVVVEDEGNQAVLPVAERVNVVMGTVVGNEVVTDSVTNGEGTEVTRAINVYENRFGYSLTLINILTVIVVIAAVLTCSFPPILIILSVITLILLVVCIYSNRMSEKLRATLEEALNSSPVTVS